MNLVGRDYFLLFSISILLVGVLTPIMRSLAIRFGVVDNPGEAHKTHRIPIPYLGGLAIAIGVVVVSYGSLFISNVSSSDYLRASSILLPGVFLSIIGLVDDILKL